MSFDSSRGRTKIYTHKLLKPSEISIKPTPPFSMSFCQISLNLHPFLLLKVSMEREIGVLRGVRGHFVKCSLSHVTRYICQYCSVHTLTLHVTWTIGRNSTVQWTTQPQPALIRLRKQHRVSACLHVKGRLERPLTHQISSRVAGLEIWTDVR